MHIDHITLQDLGIIGANSLFEKINHCNTQEGSDYLLGLLKKPSDDLEIVKARQAVVRYFMEHDIQSVYKMTNGTLVMIRKFYESNEYGTKLPNDISLQVNSLVNKIINKEHLNYTIFILEHIKDVMRTCEGLLALFRQNPPPEMIARFIPDLESYATDEVLSKIIGYNTDKDIQNLKHTHHIRRYSKSIISNIVAALVMIDAYASIAKVTKESKWTIPNVLPKASQLLDFEGLYHPLLKQPKAYDIHFDDKKNMLILTGANMSGKSTFLRSLGMAVYMAQVGMGVAAQEAQISLCSSLISNMKVQDDIFQGESYFLAEVKRMKHTAEQIRKHEYNLVLMDEIFKGTNIYDAYDCTLAIIESLQNQDKNCIVISTHLYEIKEKMQHQLDRLFYKYFETKPLAEYQFEFTYKLLDGVCEDRIGFSVLKQEGVLDILNNVEMN